MHFYFVGFPVWWLVFMAFSRIVVARNVDIVILGVQNLSFGRPGASTFPPWDPFFQLGDTLGDHGNSRNDTLGSRARLLMIWE